VTPLGRGFRLGQGGSARACLLACLCGLGCDRTDTGSALPPAFDQAVPLPGCAAFDYSPCDVRSPACVNQLAQLALCMRGEDTVGQRPAVSFASEADARELLLGSLTRTPALEPDYFEIVLTQLGLTEAHALEPETSATRLAQRWAAFYRRDVGDVVVIEHADAGGVGPDPLAREALVLHELIHALQDRQRGLDDFARTYQTDSDGSLRGSSVIEGEAQLYEQRFHAALTGVDVTAVDWRALLASQRQAAEQDLFAEHDLYSASLLRVPYAHGSEYVEAVWAHGGPALVRQLLAEPPRDMRQILGQLWGDETPEPDLRPIEPAAIRPADATLATWSTLGAWGVYLFCRPKLATAEAARQLALGWRGDRLEAFSFGNGQTAGRWSIEFADAAAASSLLAAVATVPALRARQQATRLLVLSASSSEPPGWLDPVP
jgi:hypothetical protein